jgi:large subunit ribosomal protein L25
MQKKVELQASERAEIGKGLTKIRTQGFIPAVVYGKGLKPLSLSVSGKEFHKVISGTAGSNVLITLKVEGGKALPVLTHEIQRNPVTDEVLHVDFHQINMDDKIKARIHVVLLGEAVGVKEDAGILVHSLREVEVKCLPNDIPDTIEIDIKNMRINDAVHVSDIKPPKGVEFLTASQEILVTVAPPTKEEEVAPTVAPEAVAAVPGAPAPEGPAVAGAPGAPAAPAKGGEAAPAKGGTSEKAPKAVPPPAGRAGAGPPAGRAGRQEAKK